jgi:short-subunit dehydrogenase
VTGITSGAAMGGLGGRSIYSSTKVALAYYLESMAAELPTIQFTTIYPGFVDTPINKTNPNRMWLMTPERAAPIMCRAVETSKLDYVFPWKMRLLFHMVRALPRWLYRRIARRAIDITKPQ